LAPEANDKLKRTFKIDIWSFGCIVYELFSLEKLFNNRDQDQLRESIRNFNIDQINLDTNKINPLFVRILKKYKFNFHYFHFFANCVT
jgi:serine/threonine protein kinase